VRRVCYDELGREVYRGPAECPPQQPS